MGGASRGCARQRSRWPVFSDHLAYHVVNLTIPSRVTFSWGCGLTFTASGRNSHNDRRITDTIRLYPLSSGGSLRSGGEAIIDNESCRCQLSAVAIIGFLWEGSGGFGGCMRC
jgi:hypothetical protein